MKTSRIKKGSIKAFVSKLSKGLMLPIAILPIAGLFLGIGAGLNNIFVAANLESPGYSVIPNFLNAVGGTVFSNLPVLFALGIAIAFTEDAGVAAFSAFLGWIIFVTVQSIFLNEQFNSEDQLTGYNILWYKNVSISIVGQNLGINSLQTSVFGAIVIGLSVAFLYNKFYKIQLPPVLGFFSGTRFVPITLFLFIPILSFIFLIFWPIFSIFLEKLGSGLIGMPFGIDSFIFGLIERSLIPFGLHHVFYTPLWQSSVGGSLFYADPSNLEAPLFSDFGNQKIWFTIQEKGLDYGLNYDITSKLQLYASNGWTGWYESNAIGNFAIDERLQNVIGNNLDKYSYFVQDNTVIAMVTKDLNPGSYLQGKYAYMIFGLPAAGFAMISCAKKENRKLATSIIGAAIFTTFLTGITEPIEFTFLFLSPVLFLIHSIYAGISFWAADFFGAHSGLTFSGGLIDYAIYSILPAATGFNTHPEIIFMIGILFVPLYFLTFRYYIILKDIQTPGRGEEEVKLISKDDYQSSKNDSSSKDNEKTGSEFKTISKKRVKRIKILIDALGGLDNLVTINACITRLRLTVKKREDLKDEVLKSLGSKGIVGKGESVQIIFGAEADIFKTELIEIKKELSKNNLEK